MNMTINNKTSWQGINALSLIILKKMAPIWVVIFLLSNLFCWFGYYLGHTIRHIELNQSVASYFELLFCGGLLSFSLGSLLSWKIKAFAGTDKKLGLNKLSIYPISSFSLVNLILLINILLTWSNLLICHFIWNAYLPIKSLFDLLTTSLCYSTFGLGFLFFPAFFWIIYYVVYSSFWGLIFHRHQTDPDIFNSISHQIGYLIISYFLIQKGASLIRCNWKLIKWQEILLWIKKIFRKIISLSFMHNIKYSNKHGSLLLLYWKFSYFYWCIFIAIIATIAVTKANWLFWGLGGIWLLVGIFTRPHFGNRLNMDESIYLLPLGNNYITRIRLVDYFLKLFIGIICLAIIYLAYSINYGFTVLNEVAWIMFSDPLGISLFCFAMAPFLILRLENVLPFLYPDKKIRYVFYITHAFMTIAAWFHFCFCYFVSRSFSGITYLWLLYLLLLLTIATVRFINMGYDVKSLKSSDGMYIIAIGLWLMACLAVVGYFTQGINSSMNKLTAILQIILVEMIVLISACIPLEVRLKRNRD